MTTQRSERIPELTLGWRLKMALGDMKRDEMAELLGMNPATLSRWMADKGTPPKRAFLAQWALITGVPLAWIENGEVPTGDGPTPPGGPKKDKLAALTDQKRGRTRTTRPGVSTDGYATAA